MNTPIDESTFPNCPLHKAENLTWVCLDPACDTRILCAHCIIMNHKNIHKSFNEISFILKDPLYQLVGSDFLLQSDRTKSLRDTLSEYFDVQKDKLRDILDKLLNEIMKKFEDIRNGYHEDVQLFLKQNEEKLDKIDQQRKEYDEFIKNYYSNNNFERDRLKEGMDLILSKFHSDHSENSFKKSFEEILSNVPHVTDPKSKEMTLGAHKFQNLTWSFFADKRMKLAGKTREFDVFWANKQKVLCNRNDYDTTMTSDEPLPCFFKLKLKFVAMASKDIVIGLTRKRWECCKSERSYLTNVNGEEGEYGYDPKSNGYKFSYNNKQEVYGVTCEVGDCLSIVYKSDKTISFMRNKEDMGVAFTNAEGPFYLAASLFRGDTKLEIIKCKELD